MLCLSNWLSLVAHDILKYFFPAGATVLATQFLFRRVLAGRKIQGVVAGRRQTLREIGWSLLSATIFASISLLAVFGFSEFGWNQLYFDIASYGWSYTVLALIAMIIVHDTYFYWLHRLLHVPLVLQFTHRLHHRSRTPTPWTAYSFDPIEALLQVAFAPLWIMLVPTHPLVLLGLEPSIWWCATSSAIAASRFFHAPWRGAPGSVGSPVSPITTCITRMRAGISASILPGGIAGWAPSIRSIYSVSRASRPRLVTD